jgi:hypothetical protein
MGMGSRWWVGDWDWVGSANEVGTVLGALLEGHVGLAILH